MVLRESRGHPALPVLKAPRVLQDLSVLKVYRDHPASLVLRVLQVLLGLKAPQDPLVLRVFKDLLV